MRTTDRQKQILRAIERLNRELGYPPTVRDLAGELDASLCTVHRCLLKLRAGGLITWEKGRSRTLRVVDRSKENVETDTPTEPVENRFTYLSREQQKRQEKLRWGAVQEALALLYDAWVQKRPRENELDDLMAAYDTWLD